MEFSALLPDVRLECGECPDIVILHHIKRAVQRFFGESRAWRALLDAQLVNAESDGVIPEVPENTELVRVEDAWWNGKKLGLRTFAEIEAENGERWVDKVGAPSDYTEDTPGVVRLFPLPDADGFARFRVSLRPAEGAESIPDEFAAAFRDDYINGAKSQLLMLSNKPWTNADRGSDLGVAFADGIAKARIRAARAYGGGNIASRRAWC